MTTEALAGRAIAMKAEARKRRATAILIVVGAGLLAVLPFVGVPRFTITLLTEALIFAIWAMSLDLMTGYTGMLTFGHAAGFGLGGYAAGYFAREVTADFFASLLIAELVILSVAIPIGFVAIRLSGAAFAIVSLCIAQVFFQIAVAWRSVTEGMDGLVGVPLPKMLGVTINIGTEFYLLAVLIAATVCLGLRQLVISPFGRTLGAIRVNEDRAAAIGINVRLHKWLVFVISWAISGIGGTLMVFMKAGTTPMSLYWIEFGKRADHVDFRGARHVVRSDHWRDLIRLPPRRVDDRFRGVAARIRRCLCRRRLAISFRSGGNCLPRVEVAVASPLVVRDLSKNFGSVRAVDGINLEIRDGHVHSLIGPNGAGKTTVFNCISGFLRPADGQVFLNGLDVTAWPPHRLVAAGLARTFQITKVFGDLTVIENVALGTRSRLGSKSPDVASRAKRRRGSGPGL